MSAGRSSQLVTCSSVERTKYLMSSKAIPDTSGPHVGRGFRSKSLSAFRRRSSIHSGSSFSEEMSRTTSSLRPRRAEAPAVRSEERRVGKEGRAGGWAEHEKKTEIQGEEEE